MNRMIVLGIVCALVCATGAASLGAVIGNWSGSDETWNDSDFTTIRSTAIAAGHVVLPDSSIDSTTLSGTTHFLIANPTSTAGADLGALKNWVMNGGILLVVAGPQSSGVSTVNDILSQLGASMSVTPASTIPIGPLQGGDFATTGPPYNIVGQDLNASQGNVVSGGSTLYGNGLRDERRGLGKVYVFGEHFENNSGISGGSNANVQLFLNLLAAAVIPEPSTSMMAGLATLFLSIFASGRQRPAR